MMIVGTELSNMSGVVIVGPFYTTLGRVASHSNILRHTRGAWAKQAGSTVPETRSSRRVINRRSLSPQPINRGPISRGPVRGPAWSSLLRDYRNRGFRHSTSCFSPSGKIGANSKAPAAPENLSSLQRKARPKPITSYLRNGRIFCRG